MKVVAINDAVVIETPWLRGAAEAAAYCGLGRTAFEASAPELPCRGQGRVKLYHVDTLDAWLAGELEGLDPPGKGPEGKAPGKPRRRRSAGERGRRLPLQHPKTGKLYGRE